MDGLEDLATQVLGPPNRHTLRGKEWRWGRKDSRSLVVRGPKRGSFMNHESGIGGGPIDIIADARGCNVGEAIRFGLQWAGLDAKDTERRPRPAAVVALPAKDTAAEEREEKAKNTALALHLFDEAIPVADERARLLRTYLGWRGIRRSDIARHFEDVESFFLDLRFHPATPRGANEKLPAMLGLLRDVRTREPCGIQRTFLAPNGRGKVAHGTAKMGLGRARNASIMLMRPQDDVTHGLGLAEGIETALSCLMLGRGPIWVTCGTAGMAAFPVLAGIESLDIFADQGAAGLAAARECAQRWTAPQPPGEDWVAVDDWLGVKPPKDPPPRTEVRIRPPPRGDDWNDLIREKVA
jgi:hypothetical protein